MGRAFRLLELLIHEKEPVRLFKNLKVYYKAFVNAVSTGYWEETSDIYWK